MSLRGKCVLLIVMNECDDNYCDVNDVVDDDGDDDDDDDVG